MKQIELTADGYEEAVEWLTVNGHASELDSDRKPMDGYTIISLANHLRNAANGCHPQTNIGLQLPLHVL
jgi:hypothetical protein